jgi:hypothetical protein
MQQKEIEAAAAHMKLFLVGLGISFDANFDELQKTTKRALLEIKTEEALSQ